MENSLTRFPRCKSEIWRNFMACPLFCRSFLDSSIIAKPGDGINFFQSNKSSSTVTNS